MDLECNSANHGVPHYAVCEKMIAWLNEFFIKNIVQFTKYIKSCCRQMNSFNQQWKRNPLWKLEIAETEII